ncbi:MAG: DUF4153 domain-containing protein [Aliidongia sp.]
MLGDLLNGGESPAIDRRIFASRILIAAAQAASLFLLAESAAQPASWPATEPRLYAPLSQMSLYVPLIMLLGLERLRPRPLTIWAIAAAIMIAGLAYHEVARYPGDNGANPLHRSSWLFLAMPAWLFVAQVLVIDSIRERRFIPSYPRHFDTAWQLGVQIVLTASFVGLFWGILELGAILFTLVKIDFFRDLIAHRWFAYPATTLALALAVQVTDVQPALIRGARTLALALFSWLLPLLSVILLGFLCSLPFISLAPLWQAHAGTRLFLTATALLVFLINCCYQDGSAETVMPRLKRLAGTIAAIELVPLVGLSIWALSLRVAQYGWTIERIMAASAIVILLCYAAGYSAAAVQAPIWMKRIEITNFVAAYLILAVTLALFSPIADPSRLMVASQVARLESGRVPVDKFDFAALKSDGARWGIAALNELSKVTDGPDASAIATRATQAMLAVDGEPATANLPALTVEKLAERIETQPPDRSLPADFLDDAFANAPDSNIPDCLRRQGPKCMVQFITLPAKGDEAILMIDGPRAFLFEADSQKQWRKVAWLNGDLYCPAVLAALKRGEFQIQPHDLPDLLVDGQQLQFIPPPTGGCPPT